SIASVETEHKASGGNALRAGVMGANDGLVSNFCLVMGMAGATEAAAGTGGRTLLVTGIAGLLAGAISMALGEWLSVQSSRELYERQIAVERDELKANPEEEIEELALIYQAKGMGEDDARKLAQKLAANPKSMLDTLAREELGINPQELGGSAWEAAYTSFLLFAVGAIIPVLPFIFMPQNVAAIGASAVLSLLGLFGLGAATTLLTGQSLWYAGFRQAIFGMIASAVTYGIGHLIGVQLG
ncbi:MAG: VIT1/CCC1 transporter family protein, partial [Lentisphaeria bacterium]|nr:VIT1/CCC1 transporter family protein [Lentisphaeria bacterium]